MSSASASTSGFTSLASSWISLVSSKAALAFASSASAVTRFSARPLEVTDLLVAKLFRVLDASATKAEAAAFASDVTYSKKVTESGVVPSSPLSSPPSSPLSSPPSSPSSPSSSSSDSPPPQAQHI